MKDNKLIAEFMGGILSSVPNLINLPQTIGECNILCVKGSEGLPSGTYKVKRINELKYHKSWDWLMPVVDMCYETGAEGNEIGDITHALLDCNLEATYDAVVKFLKSQNNNNEG